MFPYYQVDNIHFMTKPARSKLTLRGERVTIDSNEAIDIVSAIFEKIGCNKRTARTVAEHLADTSLCGMESHGLMRTLQYTEQFQNGYMDPFAVPRIVTTLRGAQEVDGFWWHRYSNHESGLPTWHEDCQKSWNICIGGT